MIKGVKRMSFNFQEDLEPIITSELNDVESGCPPIEVCKDFLYADPRIKFFFEVSLPAAQK